MARSADAVVIGAGVLGTSVALELARSGRSVLIVDKGSGPGLGSTSASSTIVRFSYSTRAGIAISWEAKFGWEDWAGYLQHVDPAGLARYIRTGGLVLDMPGYDKRRVFTIFDEVGVPYDDLGPAELRERFPYLDTGRYYPPKRLDDDAFWDEPDGEVGGFWTPEGGFVDDPALAAHNLLHAATRLGVITLFRRAVVAVRHDDSGVRGVDLDDGECIDTRLVVNVAGPHSAGVNMLAGVLDDFRVTTRALRQEVHAVPAPPGFSAATSPFIADGDLGVYVRPTPGSDLLVGGMEPACDELQWIDDPDAFDPNPSVAMYEAQVTRLARRMPALQLPGRPHGVVGLYDVTDDWIPIYDRTALAGFYVAIGSSGNQFKNAPAVGQLMHRLITAVEDGHDHDRDPVRWTGPHTGLEVDLGHYSRLREPNPESSFTVLG